MLFLNGYRSFFSTTNMNENDIIPCSDSRDR
jgi:hypothetical protein